MREAQRSAGAGGAVRDRARRPARRWAIVAALLLAGAAVVAARWAVATWRTVHPPRVAATAAQAEPLGAVKDVTVVTRDGVALAGWWRPPRNGAAVVFLHGLFANRAQLVPQAAALASAGYGVLLLDLRAHGASGGTTSTWGVRERLDALAGLRFVASQPEVRPGAVGAVGFSIGALAVAGAAAEDPDVAAVVLEAAQSSSEADLRRTFSRRGLPEELVAVWTARALGIDLDRARLAGLLRRVAPRPILSFRTREGFPPDGTGRRT